MRLVLFISVLLTLISCDKKIQEKPKLAQVIHLQPQEYVEKTIFYGIIQAKQSSPLVAQTDGVLDWKSESGEELGKSSLIAEIQNPENARAFTLSTNAEAIAKQQYDRSLALSNSKTTSKQQLQEREQALITAQQDLTKIEQEYKKTKFIASFNGVVGPKLIKEGTQVKTGDVIGHFFNPTDIIVEVQIPVGFKNLLKPGQTVIIEGAKYALPHVPKMLNPTNNMMILHIPIKNTSILIGEVIDVEIHLKELNKAIVIPLTAVKFDDTAASALVFKDGKLEKRELTLGSKDSKNVVVVVGLKVGDNLCLDPHDFYEGDEITPKYPEL